MVYTPNNWIQSNLELLSFIFESNVLKRKNDLLSLDKILSHIENFQEINTEKIYSSEQIRTLFQEMEYYALVQFRKNAGVAYVSPTEAYFSLKSTLNKSIISSKIPPPTQTNTMDIISENDVRPITLQKIYDNITDNTGVSREFIINLPKMIDISAKILYDERAEWNIKSMISSALGYLLISNKMESKDFMEELFLFSFILKHIDIRAHYLLVEHWDHQTLSLKNILNNAYLNTKIVLSDEERRDLLRLLGIPKLIQYPTQPIDYRKTLGMIAYLMGRVYQTIPDKKSLAYLENKLMSLGEYDEVQRILKIAKGDLIPKCEEKGEDDTLTDEEYELLLSGDF